MPTYVVHLEEEDTTAAIDDRVANWQRVLDLTTAQLRIASAIGLEAAVAIKQHVDAALLGSSALAWSGMPDFNATLATLTVICKVKNSRDFGAFSVRQLAFFIGNLRAPRPLRDFLRDYDDGFHGDTASYENIFKFLRSCEYGLPQMFALVQIFVAKRYPGTDYSFFVRELSRWFRNEALRNLDEEGVPIQISERFLQSGDNRLSLSRRLADAALNRHPSLTPFERQWLLSALDLDEDGHVASPTD